MVALEMLAFSAAVANNESMTDVLSGAMAAEQLADLFNNICGEQLDQQGQNLIKLLAENGRLTVLPEISDMFNEFKADYDKEIDILSTLNPEFKLHIRKTV